MATARKTRKPKDKSKFRTRVARAKPRARDYKATAPTHLRKILPIAVLFSHRDLMSITPDNLIKLVIEGMALKGYKKLDAIELRTLQGYLKKHRLEDWTTEGE